MLYTDFRKELFQESSEGFLPHRLGGRRSFDFTLAGMVAAHGFLQGAAPFGLLQKWMVCYLNNADVDVVKSMVTLDMVPLDETTSSLHNFVHRMEAAKEEEDLDALLNDPIIQSIINSSQWGIGTPVTLLNKGLLIQEVIFGGSLREKDCAT